VIAGNGNGQNIPLDHPHWLPRDNERSLPPPQFNKVADLIDKTWKPNLIYLIYNQETAQKTNTPYSTV